MRGKEHSPRLAEKQFHLIQIKRWERKYNIISNIDLKDITFTVYDRRPKFIAHLDYCMPILELQVRMKS